MDTEMVAELYSRLGRIEGKTDQLIGTLAEQHVVIERRVSGIERRASNLEKAEMKIIGIAVGAYALTGVLLKLGLFHLP